MHEESIKQKIDRLEGKLKVIHKRIQWIADEEAKSAVVNGVVARGHFSKEKDDLITRSEKALDEIIHLLNKPWS